MMLSGSFALFMKISLLFLALVASVPAGEVKVTQTTPPELAEFGITFEKAEFHFERPVTGRFWIEYDDGRKPVHRQNVPHDHTLPTDHFVLSYVQLANDQIAVTVTMDGPAPENRREGGTGGGDKSGTRTVVFVPKSPEVEMDRDLELYRATIKPSWRQAKEPVRTYRIKCRFSNAAFPNDPIPVEDGGYWQKVTGGPRPVILRQAPNSLFKVADVSPPDLAKVEQTPAEPALWDDKLDLSAINANEAWVAIVSSMSDSSQTWIEHTRDGGKHWSRTSAPGLDAARISFVDAEHGFLLLLGSPAAGLMKKTVFGTGDGGKTWQALTAPGEEGQSFYPTGICFRTPKEGWMAATYHGNPDAPLFHTTDGAKSWRLQRVEFPPEFRGGYADIAPPQFYPLQVNPGLMKGRLPVKFVREGRERWVYYTTQDGGATWQAPAMGRIEKEPAGSR